VVILCHLRAPFFDAAERWYLRPIFDGHVSVVLFFVLSGYVLALPFWRDKRIGYLRYFIRRFVRIYIPYAISVCVAVSVGTHFVGAQLPLSHWFYVSWHTPFTSRLIASQFLTIDTAGKINIAFWSLRYEMEMSFLIPLICKALGTLRARTALLSAIATELVGFAGLHLFSQEWLLEASRSVVWASCFILGALLAREWDSITETYATLSRPARLFFAASTVLMFYSGHDPVTIIGACGIIILARNSSACHWLRRPLPEYLGRISYSLYLLHGTVIFALLILVYGRVPIWAFVCLSLGVTLVASHFFFVLVEQPSIKLAKLLASATFHPLRLTETDSV
jgi:peptidoglycan/LPS O-acetylase OafA/YrhL